MIAEVILITIIVVGLVINSVKRPNNYPPGPIPLPIVGSFHILDHDVPQKSIDAFYERYGPITGLLMGSFKVISVSGWKSVMEVFHNDDMLGRPDVCLIRDRFEGEKYGVLFTDGHQWKVQRRFTLHHFRNLGLGRKSHEALIHTETEFLIDLLQKNVGKPIHLDEYFPTPLINVLWALIGSKRYSHNDTEIKFIANKVQESIHGVKMFGSIAVGFPFLRHLFPDKTGYNSVIRGSKGLRNFVQKEITDHESSRDENNPRDFIDAYLEQLNKEGVHPSFSVKQLQGLCIDLISAGGDTSLSVLCFAILFLCFRQDIQQQIFEEILEHVGLSRLPDNNDREKLVHIEAVLMEVTRIRSPAPTTIPHRALRDTTIGGYHIPKDTIAIINVNSVLLDPKYWDDPEQFNPRRFITSEGKIRKDERLIPFGKGKRMCIGESLSKLTTFIVLASLLQRFQFTLDPESPVPNTEGVPGFTIAAPQFKVILSARSC